MTTHEQPRERELDRFVVAARNGDRSALDAMREDPVEMHPDLQPEGAAESSAMLDRLSLALEALPPKLRVLVVLKDVYGLSHEEIAEELGISVPAAKVRLHRGRKRLRDLLYEDEGHDGRWASAV